MIEPNSRWRELYAAARLELDRDKLCQRIELAEQATCEDTKAADRIYPEPDAMQALNDALQALNLVRRRGLGK